MGKRDFIPIYGMVAALLEWQESCEAHSRRIVAIQMRYKKPGTIWETLEETWKLATRAVVSIWIAILELWVLYTICYYLLLNYPLTA